jgi:hypothetical protein
MPENLMNKAHKATNKEYRDNYDAIFRKEKDDKEQKGSCSSPVERLVEAQRRKEFNSPPGHHF